MALEDERDEIIARLAEEEQMLADIKLDGKFDPNVETVACAYSEIECLCCSICRDEKRLAEIFSLLG